MKRLLIAILFFVFAAPLHAHAEDVLTNLTVKEVSSLLKQEGYSSVEIVSDTALRVRVDGRGFLLTVFDDGDIQLYYGLTGTDADADDLNTWNRTKRLSRAYIDLDGDPVIEADFLSDRGITRRQFVSFMDVFQMTVRQFREFVSDL